MSTQSPKRKTLLGFILSGAVILGASGNARAGSLTFNFNSLADGATNSSIQTYMQGVVGALGSVTVNGAVAEQNYTGDGHVVGGTFGGNYHSNTLGTSDGATGPLNGQRTPGSPNYYDTFLVNNTSLASGTDTDRITITFTLPSGTKVVSLAFDYQIFPNASCAVSWLCFQVPDFTLKADGIQKLHTNAGAPVGPDGNNSPCDYIGSCTPNSSETAWQFIGISGIIAINDTDNVTKLEFIDWPEMIGIDNLVINYEPVPEPGSMVLFGLGLIGLRVWLGRRGREEKI